MNIQEQLLAVTPIDGRYADRVTELQPIVSEFGLIQRRVRVETGWLDRLGSGVLPDVEPLSDRGRNHLYEIAESFDVEDAEEVKLIEKERNHDVKAVEIWLQNQLREDPVTFGNYLELVHFGLTSEDVTNLAYAQMLEDLRDDVLLPRLDDIQADLDTKRLDWADVPMLAHTHGQPASPTTLGKEMAVFAARLSAHQTRLGGVAILGKFGGATGNHSAATFAYPEVDWPKVSEVFVKSLGFGYNGVTTQIEPHDWNTTYFQEVAHGNTMLTGLTADMWQYISMGYLKQRAKRGEVGSSTMPHKVNPIDFENAEGNFFVANSLWHGMADRLPVSRLQRDLRDSTIQRAIGEAAGHTVIGYKSLLKGLGKVLPDHVALSFELEDQWAVLAEPLQQVMRRYGVPDAYEWVKEATRGQDVDREVYLQLVDQAAIPDDAKARLRELTPDTYLGEASMIAKSRTI